MTAIHIEREHTLGLQAARQVARQWAEKAQAKFGLEWRCEEGAAHDLVHFSGNGLRGTLAVTERLFGIDAQLGFLAAAFKDKIAAEIVKNLDQLIGDRPA